MIHENMVPGGQTYTDFLTVENGTSKTYDIYFKISSENNTAKADNLIEHIEMKIYLDGSLFYDGKLRGLDYRSQGVDINDKHVEIIVRQMMKKVQVENPGGTDILPGEKLDVHRFEEETLNALENGLVPPQGKRILLGITKAALAKESFLSAASFQETARVLTEAAIKNKVDPLVGLKENVIIGKLIPAGTGIKNYKNVSPQTVLQRNTEVQE